MKLVEMTRDLRPWRAGDSALLPDDVADRLVAGGGGANARPFPEQPAQPEPPAPAKERPRGRYLTRNRG